MRASVTGCLPSAADYAGLRRSWRRDLLAGLTVGVVALPLALGFGVASGAGAAAGLLTAIVAGIVAAVFGGSAVQVSGPTGAMAVVLLPIVHRFGPSAIPLVAAMAGLLLLVAFLLGAGRGLDFVPWPVIEGFTIGIAAVIFLQQVPSALGVHGTGGSGTLGTAWAALAAAPTSGSWAAPATALGTIAVIWIVHRLAPSWPASLLAVVLLSSVTLGLHLARIGTLPSSLGRPRFPSGWSSAPQLASAAFAVAILAGLESLLSAKVADGLADHEDHQPGRELFGQGLANLAVSCFGGIPATGAIARTAVNVRAGARTRVAAITHSVVLAVVLLAFAPLVAKIPLAVLAGVLIATALAMVERHSVLALWRSTRGDAAVMVVTALLTVTVDLITAVEVGLVLAALLALASVSRASGLRLDPEALSDDVVNDGDLDAALLRQHLVVYRLEGSLFFGVAQRFFASLTATGQVQVVILACSRLHVLDATGARALAELVAELQERGIVVLVKGLRADHERTLRATGSLEVVESAHHLFPTMDEAIAHAHLHLHRSR